MLLTMLSTTETTLVMKEWTPLCNNDAAAGGISLDAEYVVVIARAYFSDSAAAVFDCMHLCAVYPARQPKVLLIWFLRRVRC